MGPSGPMRVSEVICLCHRPYRSDRGEARRGYCGTERHHRILGRESRSESQLLSTSHFIDDHHLPYHRKGELKTNVRETERNAATWDVCPGQEIIESANRPSSKRNAS